ncbi:M61 family metallopeptidase, partial [Burkholderia sp. Ac-20379]|uniref:M61 family metallopeptidase n=1 Tax=Burkholderia sp. Ac-20379 TaxID=2703900 RepID=UPI001981323C
ARAAPEDGVTVRYRAAAASSATSGAGGVLGDANGVLLGARYLRVAEHDGPCTVRYRVPDGWAIHHPSDAQALPDRTWAYRDHAHLLDTPVSFGRVDRIVREVRGTSFHHVFLTHAMGFEASVEGFVDDLCEIAGLYHDLFGAFPFDDYSFVLSFDPAHAWRCAHAAGSLVGLDPATFYDSDRYNASLRACAHALFQAWNGCRLRPAPPGRAEFERDGASEGRWVAEGFTRYFALLSCTRTALYTPAQFFAAIAGDYAHLAALPAYGTVSAVDASVAASLARAPYPGRANSAIDHEVAGMLIAFELDAMLRLDSHGARSLDDVFAGLFEAAAGQGKGYTLDALCAFVETRQPGLGRFLAARATEAGQLTLPDRLRGLGFDLGERPAPYLGLMLDGDAGPAIGSVLDGSPASRSGLAAEDRIQAVDGYPFSFDALTSAARQGGDVALDVLRGNRPGRYTIRAGTRTTLRCLHWAGSARQADLIAHWLQQPFAPAAGQLFPLDFNEHGHGGATVI